MISMYNKTLLNQIDGRGATVNSPRPDTENWGFPMCIDHTSDTSNSSKDKDHFWARVRRGAPDDCWLWTGAKSGSRYGHFAIKGKMWYAHRYAYTLTHGPIPDGMFVCHTCDVPLCCNPSHLFIGTHADNVRDCVTKGRNRNPVMYGDDNPSRKRPETRPRGEKHYYHLHPEEKRGARNGNAKLTEADVYEIRRLYATGEYNQHELSERFSVSRSTIGRIISRRMWSHI